MKKLLTLAGAGLAALLLFPATSQAQTREGFQKDARRILQTFAEVVAQPSEATARVLCEGKEVALATVVEADGLLLTKHSELTSTEPVVRLKDGKEHKAKIVGIHEPYDLVLLKIDASQLKPIEWRKTAAEPGDWLVTPGLDDKPLYIGVVSVAARKVTARDMPLSPVAGAGYLGVMLEESAGKVVITDVTANEAAAKAGLVKNDVIVAIDGKTIKDRDSMIGVVSSRKPGEVVTLKIRRGEEEMELKATLGRRPASAGRGDFQNNLGSQLSKRKNGFPSILQHDTVVKPADCGGPIVDLSGRAVGINIARAGRVESYAVPVDAILALLPELKSGKLAPKDKEEPKK